MFHSVLSLLLQFSLASLAWAAPLANDISIAKDTTWQYGTGGGILGFIVLILDVIVWVELVKSNRPVSHKVLWALLVFIFPILGVVIYFLFSNRQAHKTGGYEPIP